MVVQEITAAHVVVECALSFGSRNLECY